jgi:hypothetical protein
MKKVFYIVVISISLVVFGCSDSSLDENFLGKYEHQRFDYFIDLKKDGTFNTHDKSGTWVYDGVTDYGLIAPGTLIMQELTLSFDDEFRFVDLFYNDDKDIYYLVHDWNQHPFLTERQKKSAGLERYEKKQVQNEVVQAPKEVVKESEAPIEEVQIEQGDTEADIYFKIQDPDGYTNMRDAPGGSIVRRVLPNEKFKVSGESRKYKVVEFDNGETGYIHNSRVVEYR